MIYALLGTSRVLSVSTTTTIAILVGSELALIAPDGDTATLIRATATLALLVGLLLAAASFLRLGFVANFISDPVLIGFKAGIGIVIVLDQLPKLLGVRIQKGNFLHNLSATLAAIPETSLLTLAVGLLTILLLIGIEHWSARAGPADRDRAGHRRHEPARIAGRGVETVGQIPRGLPSFIPPDFAMVGVLWPGALGIA